MDSSIARLAAALTDRYSIERELGAGGMATVYLARDVKHDRQVAIKVLHEDLGATLGPERFLSEIRTTARLQHPHILPLLDSGEANGLLYYVMPYVAGESLRDRLTRDKLLPIDDARRIATEIADALGAAHALGIVHRDIKPENILIQSGHALVADFGIALAVQHAGGPRLTQTGLSLGTPQYMAPEQAMGDRSVDHRADIYALGAVLYEMLVGDPPFTGSTVQAIVAKVMTERPTPPSRVRDTVTPGLEQATLTALAKLPADRFADAAAFKSALNDQRGWTGPTAPSSHRALAPFALVAGGIVLGLALGLAAARLGRRDARPTDAPPMRFVIAPDSVALETSCCGQMMALSPDGRTLVFQGRKRRDPSAVEQLFVRTLDDPTPRALDGTDRANSLFFSPGGDQIGFVSGRRLMRMPVRGGSPILVAQLPSGFIGGGTWTDDEHIIVAVSYTLYRVPATGGELTTVMPSDTTGLQVAGPSYIAQTGALLFTLGALEASPIVKFLPRGATVAKSVMRNAATARYVPAWRALVTVREDGNLTANPFDPATGDTTGPGVRLADGVVLRSPITAYGEYAVSDNGVLVIAKRGTGAGRSAMLLVDERHDSNSVVLPGEVGTYDGARFSPDGRRLVVGAADRRSMARSVYVWDFARSVGQRLTTEDDPRGPTWNTTGDTIVYRVGREKYSGPRAERSSQQFSARAADGSGAPRPLLTIKGWVASQTSSVNGSWIAFVGQPLGGSVSTDIAVAHRDSGGLVRPYANTPFNETDPSISPDGHWMAFSSNETGRPEVYVSAFPVPGARYLVSATGGRTPAWSADSRRIFYASTSNDYLVTPFTPGSPPSFGKPQVFFRRDLSRDWTISPDGKRFLFVDTARLTELLGLELVFNAYQRP